MFNSYLQLELHIKNIWHAGHDKTMANFKSVAYVYNRCRSKYNDILSQVSHNAIIREPEMMPCPVINCV